jgi:2-polyprenyl-6-methoxyphenol hydroxylase-like FAD-dependent oxidoreductase
VRDYLDCYWLTGSKRYTWVMMHAPLRRTGWLTVVQQGHKVIIYEKEAYLGERVREWTILIHWAMPTLQKLLPDHIVADLAVAYADSSYQYGREGDKLDFYNGETGEIKFSIPATGVRRFSRTRLRGLCTRGLDVRWGKQLKSLVVDDDLARLTFEDDEKTEANLVIGTDGSKSAVRRQLIGEEVGAARPSDMAICNGTVNFRDAEKARYIRDLCPITMVAFGLNGSALFARKHSSLSSLM